MIQWDDNAVYDFLKDFGLHNGGRLERKCIAAATEQRIEFCEVPLHDIVQRQDVTNKKPYNLYSARVRMYELRIEKSKPIGTLFCRKHSSGKWFLKDGNHRFEALKKKGVQLYRIGYDPENKI